MKWDDYDDNDDDAITHDPLRICDNIIDSYDIIVLNVVIAHDDVNFPDGFFA